MRRLFIDGEGRLAWGWKLLLFFVAYEAAILLLFLPFALLIRVPELAYTAASCASALLVSLACVRLEGRDVRDLGFRLNRRWGLEFLGGTLGGILLMALVALAIHALGGFRWIRNPAAGPGALLSGLSLYVLVAIHEETVYRGYPFQRLLEKAPAGLVNLGLALYFAWIHRDNPGMEGSTRLLAFLNIALAGLLLGLGYLRTRSLAAPIGLHLGWNWAQGSLLGFGVSGTRDAAGLWIPRFMGKPDWLTGGEFGLEASIPCALICALAILLLARIRLPGPDAPPRPSPEPEAPAV